MKGNEIQMQTLQMTINQRLSDIDLRKSADSILKEIGDGEWVIDFVICKIVYRLYQRSANEFLFEFERNDKTFVIPTSDPYKIVKTLILNNKK